MRARARMAIALTQTTIQRRTMTIKPCTVMRDAFTVHVNSDELDCGARRLPYPTCIGLFNLWGVINVWKPAASTPRGYRAAAEALLRDTMKHELAARGLRPFVVGLRVELHPGCDLWMRGARFGTIVQLGKPGYPSHVAVRMDHPQVKKLQWFTDRALLTEARS